MREKAAKFGAGRSMRSDALRFRGRASVMIVLDADRFRIRRKDVVSFLADTRTRDVILSSKNWRIPRAQERDQGTAEDCDLI
ncbi:hypothetical protein [Methylobacterium soli]|uniref:Uncharacterized protein n=1 Tax=Methylobacterium soli TaxID=553447 RepID=A0A6L3T100_9HYPH|nr:hypothetical protein [Methylobacterium soli]KAB1078329.1 hypothetical protein F6X53_14635 [Methylobacterium soli]